MSQYSSFGFKKMFLEVVLFVAVSLSSAAADNAESERPLLALILHCSQPGASRDAVCPDACRRWPQYCYYAIAAENGVPGTCKLPPYPSVGDYTIEGIELAGAGHLADFTLHYSCPPGYKLNGYHPSCVSGTWYADFPSCTSVSLSPASANNKSSKCVLPPYPEHGSYSLMGRAAPPARPGLTLDAASLTVTCDPPYRPDGPAEVHCYNGQWYMPVPQCIRFCKLTPHPSVTYSCKPTDPDSISGDRKCNDFEPSGTEVHPLCNDNYYHNGVLSYMYCIDGSWDNLVTCELGCGTLTPNGEPLVINGVSAKRGEFPWHAGIYDKRFTPFMQICGGSIVSTTVIISAAHCFWNDLEHVLPAKYFAVGVGKLYRAWNIDEGGQKSDVSDLKLPPRFLGVGSNFQDDIALVILETPIVLINYVRPVCIDFNVLFNERQLQPGNVGKVAGWGLTSEDGNASPVLKVKELPYVDVEQCIADLSFDFRSYITGDKICAGTKTAGSALCKGDSGGGLVFPAVERSGVLRWYLRGVASTKPPSNDHKCNMNSYTFFTQLLKHEDIVRKHLDNIAQSAASV